MTADRIFSRLRMQARVRWPKRVAGVAFGVPLSLIAPLIMGTIFWFASYSLGFGGGVSWTTVFWVTAAVFIPLLLALEARTAGRYYADTVAETGGVSEIDATVADLVDMVAGLPNGIGVVLNPRASLAGLIEIFLVGPRMLLAAYDDLRAAMRFRHVDLRRAAEVVFALSRQPGGVHPNRVLAAGETTGDVVPAIAYLAFHQWIGLAAAGDKIWLPSDVRKRLEAR